MNEVEFITRLTQLAAALLKVVVLVVAIIALVEARQNKKEIETAREQIAAILQYCATEVKSDVNEGTE